MPLVRTGKCAALAAALLQICGRCGHDHIQDCDSLTVAAQIQTGRLGPINAEEKRSRG